uniref:uncharacterized protein LOC100185948 isoform X2 n=1 Tax=Ciona intestinalis TaxID=7719 RepID=UPI00089DAE2C|nr:uncharacterized protein LOC100185948 isoform X2 [Ciona intestinalis]|eukprot:XP_018669255.1 uncharacterized protein LOC100185948 isoform X2 [Ciona intestinalis]
MYMADEDGTSVKDDNSELFSVINETSSSKWGSIISTVGDQLPLIDSDSETSSLTDDEFEPKVFTRKFKSSGAGTSINFNKTQNMLESNTKFFHERDAEDLNFLEFEEEINLDSTDAEQQESVLSLNVITNVDLDEILDGFQTNKQTTDLSSLLVSDATPATGVSPMLMNQLVNLSSLQAGKSRGCGTDDDTTVHVSTQVAKPSTSSCGVSADLPLTQIELSSSSRTTIYIDLRHEETNQSILDCNQPHPKDENILPQTKLSEEVPEQACPRLAWEDSDTEDDDDDFENWRKMRKQFKKSVTKSSSHASNASDAPVRNEKTLENIKQIVKLDSGNKPAKHKLLNGNDVSMNHSADIFEEGKKFEDSWTKIDDILNNPFIEDKTTKLRKLAAAKVRAVREKKFHEEKLVNGNHDSHDDTRLMNGDDASHDLKGIYERQRLKHEQDESAKTPIVDIAIPNSVVRKKSSGKTTVLFAEEPKKNIRDEMNVYREKNIASAKTETKTKRTTSGIQTDETCFASVESIKRATEEKLLSLSTKDLKLAAKNVVDEKLNHVTQPDGKTQKSWNHSTRDNFSIVQNQRKQPPSATPASPSNKPSATTNTVTWGERLKVQTSLEKAFRNEIDENEMKKFPLLYDRDMTFQDELPTIPPSINSKEVNKFVLLTFQMSSPGCLVMHRASGGNRFISIDQPHSLSITHSLILSWLFALIPDNLDKPYDPPREDVFTIEPDPEEYDPILSESNEEASPPNLVEVPFNVVSLHQVWQEESQTIATHAVVIPNFFYKPDSRRKKPKKENAFLQVVWHFLQSNRVQEVCPWHTRPESPLLYTLQETHLSCATKPMSTYITASNEPQLIQKALNRKPGFFWKLIKPDEQNNLGPTCDKDIPLESTFCLLQREALTYPVCIMDLMIRLQLSCLDLVGVRLVYVKKEFIQQSTLSHRSCGDSNEIVPAVAMAIRGKSAIKKMIDIIGPRDPVLARLTDQGSMNAIYGEQLSKRRGDIDVPTEMYVFHCPRGKERVQQQLVVWFGGRLNAQDPFINSTPTINHEQQFTFAKQSNGKSNGKNKGKSRSNSTSSPIRNISTSCPTHPSHSYLVTSLPTKICVIVSARFPPQFLGDVISIATEQGYWLEGLKRIPLNEKKTSSLSIQTRYLHYFNPPPNPDLTLDEEYYELDSWWLRPVSVFMFARENAGAHLAGLICSMQSELMYRMVPPNEDGHLRNATSQCFHACVCTDTVLHALGNMAKTPELELSTGNSPRVFYSNPELEEVVVLSLVGRPIMKQSGCILQRLLHGEFYLGGETAESAYFERSDECEILNEFHGFEILGIKFIPSLSSQHSKELSPFEVGTKFWGETIRKIQHSPALVCVLRRVNAFKVLREVLQNTIDKPSKENIHDTSKLMSSTTEIAYRQIKTFFSDKELFSDNRCRPLLKYLPPPTRIAQYLIANCIRSDGEEGGGDVTNPVVGQNGSSKSSKKKKKNGKSKDNASMSFPAEESIIDSMLAWPQPLTTILIIKPDAFPRHLIKIFRRIHHEGFNVVAAKMTLMSEDQALQIVPRKFEKMPGERNVFISNMISSPTLVLCLSRHNAVRKLLDIAGPQDPLQARKVGHMVGHSTKTLRAELGIDEFSNAVHVSETYISACEEQKLFFHEGLCCNETVELKMEQVPTPAEDYIMCCDKMLGREIKLEKESRGLSGMELQPICVVLTSKLVLPHNTKQHRAGEVCTPSYVDVLEKLITEGYELSCLRMSWLRDKQAQVVCDKMTGKFATNKQEIIEYLTSGPNIVMLLQRENGLLLFDSIIGGVTRQKKDFDESCYILRTQTISQTHDICKYLFHRVENPRSVVQIVHKRATEWRN